ncbi:MAG: succinate--CoA ligase subunit alpha [Chloroflexi bacterium]|nr:succinate--CoA ligase subunit alpha [Chloroflexota bacterium]
MSVIVNKDTRVVVQGITGNQGRFHTAAMLSYGTRIIAGVSPGKSGRRVQDVPVYDTVADAVSHHGANTSIVFIPAPFVKSAVLEALSAGIKTLVVISELVPQKDAIEFLAEADRKGATIIGPNCPGIIHPANRIHIGVMPGHIFRSGKIGIVSRSGTLTYEIAWHISGAGLGQSTCVGIGGDTVIGLNFIKVLEMFKDDRETEAVVLIGEIGGNAEESAARHILETNYPKPVVAYIAGRMAPAGKRMGHAGAIVMGDTGTTQSKISALVTAGVPVAETPSRVLKLLKV